MGRLLEMFEADCKRLEELREAGVTARGLSARKARYERAMRRLYDEQQLKLVVDSPGQPGIARPLSHGVPRRPGAPAQGIDASVPRGDR